MDARESFDFRFARGKGDEFFEAVFESAARFQFVHQRRELGDLGASRADPSGRHIRFLIPVEEG